MEALVGPSKKVSSRAEKDVPEKASKKGVGIELSSEKGFEKEIDSCTAIIVYSKDSLPIRENDAHNVQSPGESFDDILNSSAPQCKNATKNKLRCEFVESG